MVVVVQVDVYLDVNHVEMICAEVHDMNHIGINDDVPGWACRNQYIVPVCIWHVMACNNHIKQASRNENIFIVVCIQSVGKCGTQ